jgi:hypothetical protein
MPGTSHLSSSKNNMYIRLAEKTKSSINLIFYLKNFTLNLKDMK